jgi:hypothetical protein
MSNLENHVQQARETLEAARTSLAAAQEAHNRTPNEATASFLQDAQTAFDQARAAYDLAAGAQASGDRSPGDLPPVAEQ